MAKLCPMPRRCGLDEKMFKTFYHFKLSLLKLLLHVGIAKFTAQMLSLSYLNGFSSDDAAVIKSGFYKSRMTVLKCYKSS